MRRKQHAIEQLRSAIDCLPVETRVAMLRGVRENDIIVGAYTDRGGGVCPMLAAHRCGGRTDFITFARSWDRFTGAGGRSRHASERELRILTTHLEASMLAEDTAELSEAIRQHKELMRERDPYVVYEAPRPRPGDPDRARELRHRPGWAWLRPFRRLDDYQRALSRVEAERDVLAAEREADRDRELAGTR